MNVHSLDDFVKRQYLVLRKIIFISAAKYGNLFPIARKVKCYLADYLRYGRQVRVEVLMKKFYFHDQGLVVTLNMRR
jgi:hypothetical protein